MNALHARLVRTLVQLADLYGPLAPTIPQYADAEYALARLLAAIYL
jgi:hypothetical protein